MTRKEGRGGCWPTITRAIALKAADHFFPFTLEGKNELEKVKEGLRNNKGVLLLTNHSSKRDGILGIQALLEHLWPLHPTIVMPIAQHQHKEWMGSLVANWGIEMHPIANLSWDKIKEKLQGLPKDEIRKGINERKESINAYLTKARATLNSGGVVALATQATRNPRLKKPTIFPIETILKKEINSSDDILIACMGIGFAEKTDYLNPAAPGYNPGIPFNAKLGKVHSLTEAMDEMGSLGIENIDLWIYRQLVDLVPTEYLGEAA